jgi:hypothetical protein
MHHQEAIGTEASDQVDCLYWLPIVKMLMRYPLPGRDNEFLEMNRLRLRAAVGLLTGHTILRGSPVQTWTYRMARMPTVRT